MFEFLKHRSKGLEARADGGYTDLLVQLATANASGGTDQATETSAVEFSVGLLGRCFAVGTVQPMIPALTPAFMAMLIRTLLLSGNFVSLIDVGSDGMIQLRPASTFDILGDPEPATWRYRLDLSGPSRTVTRRAPYDGVVHVRLNASTFTPWRGTSPLENAGVSGELLGRLESSLRDESRARSGNLLPVPGGLQDSVLATLSADLAAMRGHTALVETTADGAGAGRGNSPQTDWQPRHFGPFFGQYNVELRRDVGANICSALGVPPALYTGGGAGDMRESYRQLLVAGIQPLASIIMAELSEKLEVPVSLSFRKLQAADVAARARAYGSLVQAQLDKVLALELSGLED